MNDPAENLVLMFFLVLWIAGIVLAKGFWLVFTACVFPPYAIYLVAEKLMMYWGLV